MNLEFIPISQSADLLFSESVLHFKSQYPGQLDFKNFVCSQYYFIT